jgi:arginine decarboxylase
MAPVWEMIQEYIAKAPVRFHVPGHKGRDGASFGRAADITELDFSDDLHRPNGVLRYAQELCACAVGAFHTFFLVNGATAGIHAMLLLFAGRTVVVQRDCHKSVVAAAALGDIRLVFLPSGPVLKEEAEAILDEHPGAPVFLTYPDYYGRCCDLPAIAEAAHERGRLLLVDAAHGAHFPYSDLLPVSPAEAGADLWVDSAHKTGLALTQGAYLHVGERAKERVLRLQEMLAMLETSSPSYLILASLDESRERMQKYRGWPSLIARVGVLRGRLERAGLDVSLPRGYAAQDPLRITVEVSSRGISGFDAKKHLELRGVFVEMADYLRVVAVCSPSDTQRDLDALEEALLSLPESGQALPPEPRPPSALPEAAMGIREAWLHGREVVLPEECVGRVCACAAGVYPPGTPVIFPGEIYNERIVEYFLRMEEAGAQLFGAFAVTKL